MHFDVASAAGPSLVPRPHPLTRRNAFLAVRRARAGHETKRDRPCSALCPHYVRITPVVFPHRFRSISAIFPHCSRGISALLLLRSLSAPFPRHSAVLPHCSRSISALFPQSFRTVPAVYTAERSLCLGRFI